jgi:hypothetical protein
MYWLGGSTISLKWTLRDRCGYADDPTAMYAESPTKGSLAKCITDTNGHLATILYVLCVFCMFCIFCVCFVYVLCMLCVSCVLCGADCRLVSALQVHPSRESVAAELR